LKGSFIVIPYWATMPKTLSPICDRVFYNMLIKQPFKFMRVEKPTVNFHSMYEVHYRYLGETPPVGAKPNTNAQNIYAWINSLNTRQLAIANRLTGIDIKIIFEKLLGRVSPNSRTSRNALCSCGSGKKSSIATAVGNFDEIININRLSRNKSNYVHQFFLLFAMSA
jgi:hypothetical protein